MSDTYFLIFGIIVTLIGAVLLAIHFRDLANCREIIHAKISKVKVSKTSVRGSSVFSYTPEFTYTVEEKKYNGAASFSTRKKNKYTVGDEIDIFYSRKNPAQYRMPGHFKALIFGVLFAAVGLLFVVLNFL